MDYTRDDVIIWADDKRLKGAIGKECYGANSSKEVLDRANKGKLSATLIGIYPDGIETFEFENDIEVFSYSFLIIKKEPKKKTVPYNFSTEEDREAVKGKWFFDESCDLFDEVTPIGFNINARGVGLVCVVRNNGSNAHIEWYNGEQFMRKFHHEDTGMPAGKEIEE